ncbi:phosphotransferase [Isoptericola sp. BMS4]|uniref:phosphotransferase n=1 Tax=Isoptericola sp. BMS4 TaxID=2527875 RepID=UPI001421F4DF|nr:phosphotransferase [Isoptericola sp. BMS4]
MKADLDVTPGLARALLAEQHPDLAGLSLEVVANGWDNVMLRLGHAGDDGPALALRLPRREAAAALVRHEQATLPRLATLLDPGAGPGGPPAGDGAVAVPVPVRVGRPSDALGYPWWWSVTPWVEGTAADRTPVLARRAWAASFGAVLAALHVPAPPDAPPNPVRGIPLARRAEARDPAALGARLDLVPADRRAAAREVWQAALDAPVHDGPPVWLHGDPHPANLVVAPGSRGDRLAAVVDWGDVTSGDPAGDLGALWLLFDDAGHAACRDAVQARAHRGAGWDDATWARAAGWALLYATNMLAHPDEHPRLVPIGRHALDRLLAPRTRP